MIVGAAVATMVASIAPRNDATSTPAVTTLRLPSVMSHPGAPSGGG